MSPVAPSRSSFDEVPSSWTTTPWLAAHSRTGSAFAPSFLATCSRDAAAGKLRYSAERVRVAAAREPAERLLEWAADQLPSDEELAQAGEFRR